MSLVGLDGKEISISNEADLVPYEAGGIRIDAQDTPESMLQHALVGAQQMVAQQVGAMALQRSGSHVVANTEAQAAAANVKNPFQIEPCALAVFMLLSREIEHKDRVISALAERLDALDGKSSKELLEKPWPKNTEQNEGDGVADSNDVTIGDKNDQE